MKPPRTYENPTGSTRIRITNITDPNDQLAIKIGELFVQVKTQSQTDFNQKVEELKYLEQQQDLEGISSDFIERKMSSLPENYQPPDPHSLPTGPLDTTTSSYGFSHTMIRIKDPHVSLDFYTRILGMTVVRIMQMPAGKFTNYFLCYPQSEVPDRDNHDQLMSWLWQQQGILELCHNWGTELPASDFQGYKSGNEPEHKGFGHICVFVDDLQKGCDRFTTLGVRFKKRPEDGQMRNIAFILDPDGYWIEIIQKSGGDKTTSNK